MKVMLIGFAATIVIAFAADELLSNSGFSTPEVSVSYTHLTLPTILLV